MRFVGNYAPDGLSPQMYDMPVIPKKDAYFGANALPHPYPHLLTFIRFPQISAYLFSFLFCFLLCFLPPEGARGGKIFFRSILYFHASLFIVTHYISVHYEFPMRDFA